MGAALFLQLGCFGLDIASFCIASHKAGHMALMLHFNLFVFLTAGNAELQEQKQEAIMCIPFCLSKYLYILH